MTLTPVHVHPHDRRQRRPHRDRMRADLGPLADQRHIGMGQAEARARPPGPSHGAGRCGSPRPSTAGPRAGSAGRYRPRPARHRSHRSGHASPHRRRNGRASALPVRHLHPAEPDMVARPEGMHVKAVAQPDIHAAPLQDRAPPGRNRRRRSVSGCPRRPRRWPRQALPPAPPRHHPPHPPGWARCAARMRVEAKGLRRLRAPQARRGPACR